MRKKQPTFGILNVQHLDGPLCKFTQKWPKITLELPFILGKKESYLKIILQNNEKAVKELLNILKEHETIKYAEKINQTQSTQEILAVKKAYGVLNALFESKTILWGHLTVKNGFKRFPVILYDNCKPKTLEKKVEQASPVETNVWFKPKTQEELVNDHFDLEVLRHELTETQMKVLSTAYELGYFEWPRTHNSEEVADYLNISRTTFTEHIRSAEKKIMKILHEEYKKQ